MRFTLSAASIGAAIVLCSAADAQLIVLGSQVFLHNYVNNNGLANLGTEDFEESTLGPGLFASINDPLDANTDNMWFNPGDIHQSFRIQSNTLPNGETPSPAGANGLTLISAGHLGALSDTVTTSTGSHSLDLIILTAGVRAIGFRVVSQTQAPVVIEVYDTNNLYLGSAGNTPVNMAGGYSSIASLSHDIGRINFRDIDRVALEGIDEIEAYGIVPEPGSFIGLGVGLAIIMSMRRRK